MSMFDYTSDKISPRDFSEIVSVSRERVAIADFISRHDVGLAGTRLEFSVIEDMARRGLLCELAAVLYGLDSDKATELPEVPSDWTTVDVPDPDDPPCMPKGWRDYAIRSFLCWFRDRFCNSKPDSDRRMRFCRWMLSFVRWESISVATVPRRIRTVRRLQRRFVCPHVGLAVPSDRHAGFLLSMRRAADPRYCHALERIEALLDSDPTINLPSDNIQAIHILHDVRMIIDHYKRSGDVP